MSCLKIKKFSCFWVLYLVCFYTDHLEKIKTVIRQIICIKQNPCKVPLHIILNKPAIKIIVVLYLAIIFLTAGCFIIICKGILQRICFITVFFFLSCPKNWPKKITQDENINSSTRSSQGTQPGENCPYCQATEEGAQICNVARKCGNLVELAFDLENYKE